VDTEPRPTRSTPPPPPAPTRPRRSLWSGGPGRSAVPWVLGTVALLVGVSAVVLFWAGEDLFGSDSGTIDSYNQEVLDSCQVPDDSALVQVSIRPIVDEAGQRYRSMWYVYASPLSADEVAEFFGVDVERSMLVSPERACRFEQRPSALVQAASLAGEPATAGSGRDGDPVSPHDGLWADEVAEVTMRAELPADTRSLFRIRLAQPQVEGIF